MKKILFITPHFLPRLGGVEKHVAEISKSLDKRQWKVTVLTVQDSEDQPLKENLPFCEVVRIPLSAQKNKLSLWQWIGSNFERYSKQGIVHVHDVGWWLVWRRIFQNDKFFITFHGWEGQYPVRWQAKLHRLIIAKLSEGRIHVGKFIQQFYWDKPDLITYGGTYLGIKRKPHILAPKQVKIFFLGRLEKENLIEQYVQVVAELAKENIKVHLTWVGDGSLRHICEKWGTVTGMITDVKSEIGKADLVFANSYLSMLEAHSEGKVVCALYDTELKKSYLQTFPGRDTLILAHNPVQLANEIELILQDQQKYTALCNESYHLSHSFTWESVASVYEQLWSSRC